VLLTPTPPRRARRSLGAATALALGAALAPGGAAAQESPAPNHREVPNVVCDQDTPQADYPDRGDAATVHQRSIDCLDGLDIAEGQDGLYHPANSVNRGQMASFVARMLEEAGGDLPQDPEPAFTDTATSVHEDRIDQLAAIDVVEGRTDDTYDPHGTVSRAQMASYLVRAASWIHDHGYAPVGDDRYFIDTHGVHEDNVRAGYELWLFEGREPGTYDPSAPVTRDAMATFLTRTLDLVHPAAQQAGVQTYLMAPSEPVTLPADGIHEVAVLASRTNWTDGPEPMPGPVDQALHLALLPCAGVDWGELPASFPGEGVVAGLPGSDEGAAYFASVNGEPSMGRVLQHENVTPVDGQITATVASFAEQPDCAVVVAYADRPPLDQLRVDATGRPASPFGFTVVTWE
jgi:hypothetical protein